MDAESVVHARRGLRPLVQGQVHGGGHGPADPPGFGLRLRVGARALLAGSRQRERRPRAAEVG
ncbi:MAG: hypothetical protein MZV65_35685 [Chromatiales bacterium]|nr:hypothetical protein [Chromatiales bacterium]